MQINHNIFFAVSNTTMEAIRVLQGIPKEFERLSW